MPHSLCHLSRSHDHPEASGIYRVREAAEGGVSHGGRMHIPLSVVQVRVQVLLGIREVG